MAADTNSREELKKAIVDLSDDLFNKLWDEWRCFNRDTHPTSGCKHHWDKKREDPACFEDDLFILRCGHYICESCKKHHEDHTDEGHKIQCDRLHYNREGKLLSAEKLYSSKAELRRLPKAKHINTVVNLLRKRGVECFDCTEKARRPVVASSNKLKCLPCIGQNNQVEENVVTVVKKSIRYDRDRMVLFVSEKVETNIDWIDKLSGNDEEEIKANLEEHKDNMDLKYLCDLCVRRCPPHRIVLPGSPRHETLYNILTVDLNAEKDLTSATNVIPPWYLKRIGREDMYNEVIRQLLKCNQCNEAFIPGRLPIFRSCGHIVCQKCEGETPVCACKCKGCDSAFANCTCDEPLDTSTFFPAQDAMKVLVDKERDPVKEINDEFFPECTNPHMGKHSVPKDFMMTNEQCVYCHFDFPPIDV